MYVHQPTYLQLSLIFLSIHLCLYQAHLGFIVMSPTITQYHRTHSSFFPLFICNLPLPR